MLEEKIKADQKVVVNLKEGYKGSIQTILYDGICPYTKKSAEDYNKDGYSILTWEDFYKVEDQYLDSICGDWKEITAEQFEDALNVLPPLRWENGGFFMSERYTADVTGFYQQIGDRYFTSYQRLSYNRKDIIADLHSFMQQ